MISWSSILEKVEKDRLTETIHQVCLQGLSCFESRSHKWWYQPDWLSTQMEKPFRVWMCLCSYVLNEPCSTMIFLSKLDKDLGPDYGMKRGKSANPDSRSMWNGEHLVCYQVVDWSYESCQHHSLPTTFCHTGLKMNLQHYIACIITCFVSVWSVYVFLFSLFWMVCVEAFWIVNACKRHCVFCYCDPFRWLSSDRAMPCFIVGAPDQYILPDLCPSRPGLWRRRGAPIMPSMVVSQLWLEIHDRPNTVPSFKVTMDVSMAHLATLPRLHHLSGYTSCMSFHSLCHVSIYIYIVWSHSKFVQVICIDPIAPDADFIGRSQFCGSSSIHCCDCPAGPEFCAGGFKWVGCL